MVCKPCERAHCLYQAGFFNWFLGPPKRRYRKAPIQTPLEPEEPNPWTRLVMVGISLLMGHMFDDATQPKQEVTHKQSKPWEV